MVWQNPLTARVPLANMPNQMIQAMPAVMPTNSVAPAAVPPQPAARSPGFLSGFMDFARANPGAMATLGAGIMSGNTAQGIAAFGRQAQQARGLQATSDFLRSTGRNDLADAIEQGMDPAVAIRFAERPQSKVDQFGLPTSGSISQKARALQLQGYDPQTALGIASGRFSVSINPQTGERSIVDMAEQSIVPLRSAQQPQQGAEVIETRETPQGSETLYGMADDATGAAATVQTGISNTLGQIPGPIGDAATSPDVIRAGQEFEQFKRGLIRALSLNPRFPVAEQQRIENLVPRGAMTAPDTLRQSLVSLDQELARIEAEAMAGMNDPNSPVKQRQADAATIRSVRAARARLGVPRPEDRRDATGVPGGDNSAADPLGIR